MLECLGSMPAARNSAASLLDLGAQLLRLLIDGDGVQIDDAEDALVVVLDLDPVLQRAQIIADVQIAGRLDAGEYACFHVVE